MWTGALQTFAAACGTPGFFGIPTWYEYLVKAGIMQTATANGATTCEMVNLTTTGHTWTQVILLISLAVLDILLRLAGLVAVGYVFYGGIRYVTSHGEADKTKEAQESIVNALIGLVIALAAITAVSYIGNTLG